MGMFPESPALPADTEHSTAGDGNSSHNILPQGRDRYGHTILKNLPSVVEMIGC